MRQTRHQPGTKALADGWPWIFQITGALFSVRRGSQRKYKLTTNPGWAKSLTITVPASAIRPFTDLRTAAHG